MSVLFSVADPYHFDTDPESEKGRYGFGSRKTIWIRIHAKKDSVTGKSLKFILKTLMSYVFVFILLLNLTITFISIFI